MIQNSRFSTNLQTIKPLAEPVILQVQLGIPLGNIAQELVDLSGSILIKFNNIIDLVKITIVSIHHRIRRQSSQFGASVQETNQVIFELQMERLSVSRSNSKLLGTRGARD